MNRDLRVDQYILKAEEFAVPVLETLRTMVHSTCPGVEETLKWGFPHFIYKGKTLCYMASFKKHCAFGFWLSSKMVDTRGLLQQEQRDAMGNFGKIARMQELPPLEVLAEYVIQAATLIEAGVTLSKKTNQPKPEMALPVELNLALQASDKARMHFNKMSVSHRNEYAAWIAEAKQEATRQRRAETAIEWLESGKSRNWKYENR